MKRSDFYGVIFPDASDVLAKTMSPRPAIISYLPEEGMDGPLSSVGFKNGSYIIHILTHPKNKDE